MARLNSDGSLDYTDDPYAAPSPPLIRKKSAADPTMEQPGDNPFPAPPEYPTAPSSQPTTAPEPVTTPPSAPPTSPAATTPGFTPDPGKGGNPPPAGAPPLVQGGPTPVGYITHAPSGGNFSDPNFATEFVTYWANQPGTNPSLKSDPGYWIGQLTNGHLGTDENYIISRFKQAEGAPEGGGGGGTTATTPGGAPGNNSQLSDFLSKLLSQQSGYNSTIAGQRQSLLDRLKGLADQYSRPVTADDPNIKSQTDAYHGTSARSLQDFRAMAAERANAEGVPSGAFDSQIGNATNTAGQAEAGFTANLMQTQMMANRKALSDILTQSAGVLSSQDSSDIQNKIAAIDASLGEQNLNQNYSLGSQGLSLQRLLGLLGLGNQSTAINNQNNQFYDKFAYDQANTGHSQDDLLLQWLLQNG